MSCIKVALPQYIDYESSIKDLIIILWPIYELSMNSSLVHYFIAPTVSRYLSCSSELGMTLRDLVYLCVVSRLSENVWPKMYGILLGLQFWTVFYFSIANANSTLKIRRIHRMPSLSLHSDIYIYYIHVIYNSLLCNGCILGPDDFY